MNSEKIVALILAVFLPPLAVFMKYGCEKELWIDIILCIIFYFPGMLYAVYCVLQD
ncbi:hypothetical protein BABINDRAFT_160462 [Babjeviella inositovora NRRL Y-12698]|uniref:Plasma membrane proteolipid 3 n=1 Tax=Babjeviella inositovora NRRL Y-12698 TaxID=984486 RepID=A0A1E3QU11_9ASCO|nr:uncharacterized protein BABINDRAFT_160462 [Babjeviella inositovora NRRL Y-12698]ODQ81044.1 hypothetical protein BABINDRAFT_160462 [Babjeviella inositovora NRRL Y-12698]